MQLQKTNQLCSVICAYKEGHPRANFLQTALCRNAFYGLPNFTKNDI